MALSDISGVTNVTMWDECRRFSPHFQSHTSKGTKELFTEKGFESLKRTDIGAINEFFEISLRIAFQKLDVSRAKNIFEGSGLLQYYDTPNGGYVQRMAVDSIKPVSPAYRGLKDGDSVDPWIVRKPTVKERFFQQNFDYQSMITMQDFQVKTIFTSDQGMGGFVAGVMIGLRNGYTVQESTNVKQALHAAMTSTAHPLQSTQVVDFDWTEAAPTDAQLLGFIQAVKFTATQMRTVEQSSAYNAAKFATVVDDSDYVLLVRAGMKDRIQLQLEVGAFNPDRLTLPFDVVEVDNFGGCYAYYSLENGVPDVLMTEVYSKLGEMVGYVPSYEDLVFNGDPYEVNGVMVVSISFKEGGETVTRLENVIEKPLMWDPHMDVKAILCQKGLVFENRQNPYELAPIYNPRGMYTNYFANSPCNGIVIDPNYNMVVFRGVTQ